MMKIKVPILMPFSNQYLNSISFDQADFTNFDALFVGSDQVWNPEYIGNDIRYFLNFVPPEKRFSYAASFGVSEIPSKYKDIYKESLNSMNKISVREVQGVNIVKSISDITAKLVADPTLLLTQNAWNDLARVSDFSSNENYVLIYILGELSPKNSEIIVDYAKSKHAKIITIMGDVYDSDYWIPTPIDFLAAIRGATAVFTDSFHCSVFSIIFNIPFIVFDRSDMPMISRIDNLLTRFSFQKNKFNQDTNIALVLAEMSFEGTAQVLYKERSNGIDFIKACLDNV